MSTLTQVSDLAPTRAQSVHKAVTNTRPNTSFLDAPEKFYPSLEGLTELSCILISESDNINTIIRSFGMKRVYVFGSVARGTDTDESDVNFLIEGDDYIYRENYNSLRFALYCTLGNTIDMAHRSDFKNGDDYERWVRTLHVRKF